MEKEGLNGKIRRMERKNLRIIKNKELAENFFWMEIENGFSEEFFPGQFIYIKIPPFFLRRPFSVAKMEREKLCILYQIKGKGTETLSKKRDGEYLDIIGPLGNGFPFKEKWKKVYLVGGGTGIAPLIFLSENLRKKCDDVVFFYGARNKKLIFKSILPENIEIVFSTEDGSFGYKGKITEVLINRLDKDIPDVVFSAGPEGMLKEIGVISKKYRIPCYVSVERRMGCGMGLCYGCVIKVKKGKGWEYVRVCKEGPVFNVEDIIWEDEQVEYQSR